MTETDSDITRGYRREGVGVGTNTNNDDITRGITNDHEDIAKGYEDITNDYEDIINDYNERE